jgi:hypothetical protein
LGGAAEERETMWEGAARAGFSVMYVTLLRAVLENAVYRVLPRFMSGAVLKDHPLHGDTLRDVQVATERLLQLLRVTRRASSLEAGAETGAKAADNTTPGGVPLVVPSSSSGAASAAYSNYHRDSVCSIALRVAHGVGGAGDVSGGGSICDGVASGSEGGGGGSYNNGYNGPFGRTAAASLVVELCFKGDLLYHTSIYLVETSFAMYEWRMRHLDRKRGCELSEHSEQDNASYGAGGGGGGLRSFGDIGFEGFRSATLLHFLRSCMSAAFGALCAGAGTLVLPGVGTVVGRVVGNHIIYLSPV